MAALIRWSAHLSMLFRELPLEERPAAARLAGFDCVDSWWPAPQDADGLARELGRHSLGVACLNCFGGDIERGERGFLNVAARHEQTLADFAAALDYAALVGAVAINVLAGRALPDIPRARQLAVVEATLRDVAAEAARAGVTVLVEPLNELDIPGSLVPDASAGAELIEAVGSGSLQLLYDAYHAAAAGSDPLAEGPALVDLIGHVQYADFPGRGAPGTGDLDLHELVEGLDRAGYDGAIGLEFEPRGTTARLTEIVGPYDRAVGGRP